MPQTGVSLAGALLLTACASFSPELGPLRAMPADGGAGGDSGTAHPDGAAQPDAAPSDAAGPDSQATEAGPQVWTVDVGANGTHTFAPSSLTIHAGDTVHWVWQASGHTVTSGTGGTPDGRFCSPSDTQCSSGQTSNAGDTYDHVFATPGVFAYFCSQHQGMIGTVTVQ